MFSSAAVISDTTALEITASSIIMMKPSLREHIKYAPAVIIWKNVSISYSHNIRMFVRISSCKLSIRVLHYCYRKQNERSILLGPFITMKIENMRLIKNNGGKAECLSLTALTENLMEHP